MRVDGLRHIYPNINYMTIKDLESEFAQMHRSRQYRPEEIKEIENMYRQFFMDKERTKNNRSFTGWNFKRNPLFSVDLTPMLFPVSDEDLNESHFRYYRAGSWFGIGKWLIAEDCYYKALEIGLYTNNMTFVFSCLASICLNYLAGYEFNEPMKIIDALSEIESYEKEVNFAERFFTIELMTLAHLEKWDDINFLKQKYKQFKPYSNYFNLTIEVYKYLASYESAYAKIIEHWNSLWKKINK